MPTEHAKDYSASSSERWLNCAASVAHVRNYEQTTSASAEEGTAAHELGELGLKDNTLDIYTLIGTQSKDAPSQKFTKEMCNYVTEYINYVKSISGDLYVEERVSFEHVASGGFGTSDAIVVNVDNKELHVVDLKYGKGIPVSAKDNTQAQLYALGVINEFDYLYDFDNDWSITLHIYQPRIGNFSTHTLTMQELGTFAERVIDAVQASKQEHATYTVTEKGCQWCAHKANCTALQEYTVNTLKSDFDDLTMQSLPSPNTVDVELILKAKPIIESWLKAVEQQAFEQALSGNPPTNFKLVEGTSRRKWKDENQAFLQLLEQYDEDELYEVKPITLAKVEKLIGKADFQENYGHLVHKPDGKPTLVHVSDKRPAIGDVTDDFDEL